MGLALLVVIWLITLVSTYFFAIKRWYLPALASVHGGAIDSQFTLTFIAMGVVFLAAQLGLGLFVWKYRDRRDKPQPVSYSHGNTRMELAWTTLTAILFIGLNLMGERIWAENKIQQAGPNATQVEVTGLQFAWYFRYPGADNTFGRTKVDLQDASSGNAVGLDDTDPAAKDDVTTGTLYVPVDREVDITLRAQDVIHSFFIPNMRIKQDAVPGLKIHMHFTPNKIGDYEIACAELCGLGHYKMRGMLKVVSQQDFDKWQAERLAEKQQQ